jgi:hypothetical protein
MLREVDVLRPTAVRRLEAQDDLGHSTRRVGREPLRGHRGSDFEAVRVGRARHSRLAGSAQLALHRGRIARVMLLRPREVRRPKWPFDRRHESLDTFRREILNRIGRRPVSGQSPNRIHRIRILRRGNCRHRDE